MKFGLKDAEDRTGHPRGATGRHRLAGPSGPTLSGHRQTLQAPPHVTQRVRGSFPCGLPSGGVCPPRPLPRGSALGAMGRAVCCPATRLTQALPLPPFCPQPPLHAAWGGVSRNAATPRTLLFPSRFLQTLHLQQKVPAEHEGDEEVVPLAVSGFSRNNQAAEKRRHKRISEDPTGFERRPGVGCAGGRAPSLLRRGWWQDTAQWPPGAGKGLAVLQTPSQGAECDVRLETQGEGRREEFCPFGLDSRSCFQSDLEG